MNNYLAIDTSTQMLTIALSSEENVTIKHELAPREHGKLILPCITELLEQAKIKLSDVTAIFVGIVPGGFTGIRIGVGVVQGIAAALDLPVVGVSSLQIIAQQASDDFNTDHILVAQDARMKEVYWAAYKRGDDGLVDAVIDDQLRKPDEVDIPNNDAEWLAVGDAWNVYEQVLKTRLSKLTITECVQCYPTAQALLKLGEKRFHAGDVLPPEKLIPVYLRKASAWIP